MPFYSSKGDGVIFTNVCFSLTACASVVCRLVMPLVCKDMVDILDVGVNSTSANHTSLSNFAFLYGVFPTAPSVAIYAGHYNMELEVVSSVHLVTSSRSKTQKISGHVFTFVLVNSGKQNAFVFLNCIFPSSFLEVTSGMVISTFLSAPIIYVSAWLLTIPLMDPTPLVAELENVSFNISIVSLIALVSRVFKWLFGLWQHRRVSPPVVCGGHQRVSDAQ